MALFSLSRYALIPVLTDWLESEDLINFDSAVCNQACREAFVILLNVCSHKFIRSMMRGDQLCLSMCRWLAQRFQITKLHSDQAGGALALNNYLMWEFRKMPESTELLNFLTEYEKLEVNCTKYNEILCESMLPKFTNVREVLLTVNCLKRGLIHAARFLNAIADHYHNLTVLVIKGCCHVTDQLLSHVIVNCPQLTELTTSECALKGSFLLTVVAQRCARSQIKKLHCESLIARPFDSIYALHASVKSLCCVLDDRNERSVQAVLWNNVSQLEEMRIISRMRKTLDAILDIACSAATLKSLNVTALQSFAQVIRIQPNSMWNCLVFLYVYRQDFTTYRITLGGIFKHCVTLTVLHFGQPTYTNVSFALTPSIVEFNCSNLHELELYATLSAREFVGLFTRSASWKKVVLLNYHMIGPEEAEQIAPNLINLEEFSFPLCQSHDCFQNMVRHCTHLKVLSVPRVAHFPFEHPQFLSSVTDLALEAVQIPDNLWLYCPQLESIKAYWFPPECIELVYNLPRLRCLQTPYAKNLRWSYPFRRVNKKLKIKIGW